MVRVDPYLNLLSRRTKRNACQKLDKVEKAISQQTAS